tara:strand:+ start:424 stop:900 length:477 start_codon:yes stop_codon:yes gene_type:complete
MITFLKLVTIIALFISTSCGFKVSNNALYGEYYIKNIENIQSNKVDFLIKQNLRNKLSNENALKKITLEINNLKTKEINEKNIQNQVTKYELEISSELTLTFLGNMKTYNINVKSKGIYNVSTSHIGTKKNQENLEKYLANKNVEKILKEINNLKNDI